LLMILRLTAAAFLAASSAADMPPYADALMARLEAKAILRAGAYPLRSYDRSYAFDSADGGRAITAVYLHKTDGKPGRRWVSRDRLPIIFDGGCFVVTLHFDAATGKMIDSRCNGVA
jgi:hypothetical protein